MRKKLRNLPFIKIHIQMNKRILYSLMAIFFVLNACNDPKKEAFDLVREGVRLVYKNDNEGAKQLFIKAIELDPENAEAWFQKANCYADENNYPQAVSDYSEAIRLNPNYADAYFNRGQIKYYQHDQEGSCADYLKADSLGKENMQDYIKHCK